MSAQKRGTTDIYAMRRKKKRRRILQQGILFLLLAMAILVLYQRRDSWLPQLETMGHRHQGGIGTTDGKFPIYIYGGNDYQTGTADGQLLVLSDSYLHIYEPDGTLTASRQHTYGSAMLRTAGSYAMIYESGGKSFRLETVSKIRFEKTLSDPIIFGRVSESGLTAVVTGSSSSACRLLVFNAKGQQVYERSCIEELTEVAFHADGNGCYAASIESDSGELHSVIHSYSFYEEEDLWTSKPLDTLAISVYNTSEGDVFVLGETMSCFLSPGGALKSSYVYPDALVDGVCVDGTAAVLLSNTEKRTRSVVLLDGNANHPVVRSYAQEIKGIGLVPERSSVLIQFRNRFQTVSYTGTLVQETVVSDSYDGFLRFGGYLFLNAYDHIDRVEYAG